MLLEMLVRGGSRGRVEGSIGCVWGEVLPSVIPVAYVQQPITCLLPRLSSCPGVTLLQASRRATGLLPSTLNEHRLMIPPAAPPVRTPRCLTLHLINTFRPQVDDSTNGAASKDTSVPARSFADAYLELLDRFKTKASVVVMGDVSTAEEYVWRKWPRPLTHTSISSVPYQHCDPVRVCTALYRMPPLTGTVRPIEWPLRWLTLWT